MASLPRWFVRQVRFSTSFPAWAMALVLARVVAASPRVPPSRSDLGASPAQGTCASLLLTTKALVAASSTSRPPTPTLPGPGLAATEAFPHLGDGAVKGRASDERSSLALDAASVPRASGGSYESHICRLVVSLLRGHGRGLAGGNEHRVVRADPARARTRPHHLRGS